MDKNDKLELVEIYMDAIMTDYVVYTKAVTEAFKQYKDEGKLDDVIVAYTKGQACVLEKITKDLPSAYQALKELIEEGGIE